MTIRRLFFWLHLTAGAVAGLVILLMSVTGVLLTFEKEMTSWADRGFQVAPAGTRLPAEALLEKIRESRQALPANFALRADLSAPAMATFGRDTVVYANPYTGEILGEGSRTIRTFFQSVTSWHRWLGVDGARRPMARAITGACNFAFLFLVLSGLYLWLPRKWSRTSVNAIALYRGGLSGRARDFNWHNVTGIWCFLPLVLIVTAGVVMSYPWANALVYRVAGSAVPVQGNGGGREGGREGRPAQEIKLEGINTLWTKAEAQVPAWQSISLRIPAGNRAPVVFTIDQGNGIRPQTRGTLTLDRKTGDVKQWETFDTNEPGRKLRTWFRFVHTGEYYGATGQTIAGIATAGAALLVWTGLSMALRRLRKWLASRPPAVQERRVGVHAGAEPPGSALPAQTAPER
jgi:uncharacterized iron-regulated membrane protein